MEVLVVDCVFFVSPILWHVNVIMFYRRKQPMSTVTMRMLGLLL